METNIKLAILKFLHSIKSSIMAMDIETLKEGALSEVYEGFKEVLSLITPPGPQPIPVEGDVQIFDDPDCTTYATGEKQPGDKVYARVNVPWSEGWEIILKNIKIFEARINPYKIGFYDGIKFLSSESQTSYTAGQIVELTLDYYASQDITDTPKVFTKP